MMLTAERLREVLKYNPYTGIFTWRFTRPKAPRGKVAGSLGGGDDGKYLLIKIDGHRYYAHRLAWFYVYCEWPASNLDHIDKNKQNNSIDNLRLATVPQNGANAKVQKRNKLGLKGVRLHKSGRYYQARIVINYKDIHLGYFPTAEAAHEAYLVAAKRQHGEFASG